MILLQLNILFIVLAAIVALTQRLKLASSTKQNIIRLALMATFIAPITSKLTAQLIEPSNIFQPPIQIAAASPNEIQPRTKASLPRLSVTSQETRTKDDALNWLALALAALTLASVFKRAFTLARDRSKLNKIDKRAFLYKRVRKLEIKISADIATPFTTTRTIYIPQPLLEETQNLTIAIKHELQHLRQNDLQWNFLLEAARLISGWNPLVRQVTERIEEIDELACDENLLGRGQIDVKGYATCLYEVAMAAQTKRGFTKLAGTAGMATSQNFLMRRIKMTLLEQNRKRTLASKLTIVLTLAVTTATAWASEGLIKDRRISRARAEALARKSKFPITIDQRSLEYLNKVTGTPRTRFYMRNALKRMQQYKPMIEAKMRSANMPTEMIALGLMESGFQNTETMTSAGIWQFVPETARRYGLQVDDANDERLDSAKETDAAIAYLAHLQSLFNNDWSLSLLSYNAGESTIQTLIAQTGARDLETLTPKLKSDENKNYVPKFMAALLVVQNPDLLAE